VLPVEINHEAPRIVAYNKTTSTEALQDDVIVDFDASGTTGLRHAHTM
jgi:hypothetical protein